jgi:hypothetical protein
MLNRRGIFGAIAGLLTGGIAGRASAAQAAARMPPIDSSVSFAYGHLRAGVNLQPYAELAATFNRTNADSVQ